MDEQRLADELAANLRAARARRNLSQTRVADLADVALMSVSRYENGITLPSVPVLYKLAAAYGVEATSLLPANATVEDLPKGRKKK